MSSFDFTNQNGDGDLGIGDPLTGAPTTDDTGGLTGTPGDSLSNWTQDGNWPASRYPAAGDTATNSTGQNPTKGQWNGSLFDLGTVDMQNNASFGMLVFNGAIIVYGTRVWGAALNGTVYDRGNSSTGATSYSSAYTGTVFDTANQCCLVIQGNSPPLFTGETYPASFTGNNELTLADSGNVVLGANNLGTAGALDLGNLTAGNVVSGVKIAESTAYQVIGTASGGNGVSPSAIVDASYVLTGHANYTGGANGTLTLPAESAVLASYGSFGAGGNAETGTLSFSGCVSLSSLTFPAAGLVATSAGDYGIGGNITPALDLSGCVAMSAVAPAACVVSGVGRWTGASGANVGTYPTTATSQAAQLATDEAAVAAAGNAAIVAGNTILGVVGNASGGGNGVPLADLVSTAYVLANVPLFVGASSPYVGAYTSTQPPAATVLLNTPYGDSLTGLKFGTLTLSGLAAATVSSNQITIFRGADLTAEVGQPLILPDNPSLANLPGNAVVSLVAWTSNGNQVLLANATGNVSAGNFVFDIPGNATRGLPAGTYDVNVAAQLVDGSQEIRWPPLSQAPGTLSVVTACYANQAW